MNKFISKKKKSINNEYTLNALKKDKEKREIYLCKIYDLSLKECLKEIKILNNKGILEHTFYVPLYKKHITDYSVIKASYYIYIMLKEYGFNIGYIQPNKIIITWKFEDDSEEQKNIYKYLMEESAKTEVSLNKDKKYLTLKNSEKPLAITYGNKISDKVFKILNN